MEAQGAGDLIRVVTLLGAAVVAVPLFKRIGLGSVLGYLAAGLIIGPFGLKLVTDSHAILHIAEFGVVMFLFMIGLEMKPSHLWRQFTSGDLRSVNDPRFRTIRHFLGSGLYLFFRFRAYLHRHRDASVGRT